MRSRWQQVAKAHRSGFRPATVKVLLRYARSGSWWSSPVAKSVKSEDTRSVAQKHDNLTNRPLSDGVSD
jgi:hypothetical protein